jgi:predicted alpha/beta hydrolase family esterase
MPTPYKPSYHVWKGLFANYPLDADTILVAHSCGCGFLLRYLSENPQKLKKLILVAPWLDPEHVMGDFLKFTLNPDLAALTDEIHIFYSEDEPVNGVGQTVDLIRQTYKNTKYHGFKTHGHFCLEEMGTDAFHELLEVIDCFES